MISSMICISNPIVRRCLRKLCTDVPFPLRPVKSKSQWKETRDFIDSRRVRAIAGNGGDGCISLLHLWSNENAGTDGGDGGNGGHVLIQASTNIKDLDHVTTVLQAENGEKGKNKDCHGKNAQHTIIQVPVGTAVKSLTGEHLGDLDKEGAMYVLARGGAGGKGNAYFVTDTQQTPLVAEYGANGEDRSYILEIKSMANFGLVGLPNAGKSTLLQAISRAKPKVASYPFTTIRPSVGIIMYSDYEQLAVADLPGLIEGSHKNRGLGIQFLKHLERCACLLYIVDVSQNPTSALEILKNEVGSYNSKLLQRPYLIVANKIDLPAAEEGLREMNKQEDPDKVIAISAKFGKNITKLLYLLREIYDKEYQRKHENNA
ncbi:uncharacterized protein LOC106668326 isoform X3 [Cimex lectularius]|uniref:Mitochondrial ribosome-associated GTPase n=1 Tax=Cimex lectularius TaxID=79782 RepID=A0A8I6RZ08_CIMLE|nr:uncharacterized protein LOC106668326 isoform X3 [Cimex lectularius]